MFRVKRMQWWGALVVTVWFFAGATVQAGTWTPLANQPTFLNPPSQCALYPNANCAPPGNFSFGGVFAENLLRRHVSHRTHSRARAGQVLLGRCRRHARNANRICYRLTLGEFGQTEV